MGRKQSCYLGSLVGRGELYCRGKQVAKVSYRLQEWQEFLVMRTRQGQESQPKSRRILGSLDALVGEERALRYEGDVYLRLEDGRGLRVAPDGHPDLFHYAFRGVGDFMSPRELQARLLQQREKEAPLIALERSR